MSAIGYASGPLVLDSLDMQRVLELLLQRYSQVWASLGTLPRLATSRVRLTTYHSWVFRGEWLDRPAYLFLRLPHRPLCQFVRFKLGCHSLAIETGRWHGTPRLQRLCHRCTQGALDDERHLVFECPAFEDLRREHRQLFDSEVAFDTVCVFCTQGPAWCCDVYIRLFAFA